MLGYHFSLSLLLLASAVSSLTTNSPLLQSCGTNSPPLQSCGQSPTPASNSCSCGFSIRLQNVGQHGSITSPKYPNNYCDHSNCIWTIENYSSKNVQITVCDFNTENRYDVLKFYKGALNGQLIESCTGSGGNCNRVFTSSSQLITIQFTSDGSVTEKGFWLSYVLQAPGLSTTLSPWTQNPSTWNPWTRNPTTWNPWTRNPTTWNPWTRNPTTWNPWTRNPTTWNPWTQYTTWRPQYPTTTPNSGTPTPSSCPSYYPTPSTSCSCGSSQFHAYLGQTGFIESPKFPNSYCNNADCAYHIYSEYPSGYSIKITMCQFHTEFNFDFLNFYRGQTTNSANLIKRCTGESCVGFTLPSQYLTIQFTSDYSNTNQGFLLTYTLIPNRGTTWNPPQYSTTMNPWTQNPTTWNPWTQNPTTWNPWTRNPTTWNPWTRNPTTWNPWTRNPTTWNPWTRNPTTWNPWTQNPTTWNPWTRNPTSWTQNPTATSAPNYCQPQPTPGPSSCQCGGQIFISYHGAHGIIKSPNYPNNYCNNLACTWTINNKNKYPININICDFYIEYGYDTLKFFDGTTSGQLLESCSGYKSCSGFTASVETLTIQFLTDGTATKSGFYFSYAAL